MTDPEIAPHEPTGGLPTPEQGRETDSLARYFMANRDRFTDAALDAAARAAGYSDEAIADAHAASIPNTAGLGVKANARRVVVVAYIVAYVALVGLMFANDRSGYSVGVIGSIVLAVALVLALIISLLLVRRARPSADLALGGLLAAPMVLLLVVSGLCVATGLPLPPRYAAPPADVEPGAPPADVKPEAPPEPAGS